MVNAGDIKPGLSPRSGSQTTAQIKRGKPRRQPPQQVSQQERRQHQDDDPASHNLDEYA